MTAKNISDFQSRQRSSFNRTIANADLSKEILVNLDHPEFKTVVPAQIDGQVSQEKDSQPKLSGRRKIASAKPAKFVALLNKQDTSLFPTNEDKPKEVKMIKAKKAI